MKRVLDISLILIALPVLAPILICVALLVRFKMGSPVFFRQERAGLGGKCFRLIKFRSMREGEERDEERLTPFGRFLRASSLDELPELWNVLKGDMSLVGPRPLPMRYLPRYTHEQNRRHEVLPGITGLAQVNGRNALDWETKFRYDVAYVDHHGTLLDLKILFETARQLLSPRGISHEGEATMSEFRGLCDAPANDGQPPQDSSTR